MLALCGAAHAQAESRVVIVRTAGDEAIVSRVRAELSPSAFEVVETPADAASTRSALAEVAAEHGASAALRVRSGSRGAELWSASQGAGAQGALDVISVPSEETHADEVLALRIVETLRARALGFVAAAEATTPEAPPEPELQPQPTAPTEATTPEDDAVATPRIPTPRLWLELAPSIVLSGGGLAPQLGALLGGRVQLTQLVSIGGFAVVPLWREELSGDEGRASVATWLFGGAIDVHARWQPVELSAGAGLATVLTQMSGSTAPPFESEDELETSAAPLLRASLYVDLTAQLRLSVRGMLGAALPELSVRFDQREIASWGRPFALLSLGVEVPLARL